MPEGFIPEMPEELPIHQKSELERWLDAFKCPNDDSIMRLKVEDIFNAAEQENHYRYTYICDQCGYTDTIDSNE